MKKLLIILAVAMAVAACGTKKVVIYDHPTGNAAQLYVDNGNHMSAVYINGVPYYVMIEARTGKFIYELVPIWRVGYLVPVKNVEINLE